MQITLPELSLVVLIGASGSGKSTLARRLFKASEILSSDTCRGWVSDDDNNQEATNDAFDVLHYIARKRLARGLLTVVDATNVRPEDREPLVALAREFHCLPVAIVVDTPEHVCQDRNETRPDRAFGAHVIRGQRMAMRRHLRGLNREGFRHVFTVRSQAECDAAVLTREPLWNNRKAETGPFDIIGDVHGCYDELVDLLGRIGYVVRAREGEPEGACDVTAPVADGVTRKLIFLGDLVDRGPKTPATLRIVMDLVSQGKALCVPGNHDVKLLRSLRGKNVQITHGLAESLAQLGAETKEFREKVAAFIDDLVSHYVLDAGRLVVAHAGMKQSMQGRGSGAVREFAMYGETTGETDEFGLPVRFNWAAEYRGRAAVVYGHTPTPEAEWLNNTICIDTGCVFGGALTALRWPEREMLSVKARATYAVSRKPFTGNVFGDRRDGTEYVPRPSVYALMRDSESRIAVVDTSHGRSLPGGGAEEGETPAQTLAREVREECGLNAIAGRETATAIEYMDTDDEGPVAKQCTFMEATLTERADGTNVALECEHEVLWLSPDEATQGMSHQSHVWAIRQFTRGGALSLQQQHDDLLDLDDISGKRHIETRLARMVTVRPENAAAALEIMSRFAADPRWLIYLPPTMSPSETTREEGMLEHPREAFEHYRTSGVGHVICEEKHMGSRAVAIVCREQGVVRTRFGIASAGANETLGIIYTRTGRPFFNDAAIEQTLLKRLRDAVTRAGLWEELDTDWLCLDCELMPWSAKAQALIREQYAAVGAAAGAGLGATVDALKKTRERLADVQTLLDEHVERLDLVERYTAAYRRYCWNVASADDYRLAPFHVLAGEAKAYVDRDHRWHMDTLARLASDADPVFVATPYRLVDLSDQASIEEAIAWWTNLTSRGGEGMVVKPLEFIARGMRGVLQPAIKVRGVEYLRIIYGPEYTRPENLDRLRSRGLGAKRGLALREFALGVESLERFVRREPLRRVHECVFAALAMESEPVDPRL